MKTLFVTLVLLSMNAQAAFQCDLNVNPSGTEAGSYAQVTGAGHGKAQWGAKNIAEAEALKNCISSGGIECAVSTSATVCNYHSNGSHTMPGLPFLQPYYTCDAIAEGKRYIPGRTLGKKEIAAQKKILTCNKIDKCRNDALLDDSVTPNFFEKLDYLAKKNDCE